MSNYFVIQGKIKCWFRIASLNIHYISLATRSLSTGQCGHWKKGYQAHDVLFGSTCWLHLSNYFIYVDVWCFKKYQRSKVMIC